MVGETQPRIMTPITIDGHTILRDDTPLNDFEKLVSQFKSDRSKVEEEWMSDSKRKSRYNNFFDKIWMKLFGISGKFLWRDTKEKNMKVKICTKKKCGIRVCKTRKADEACRYR